MTADELYEFVEAVEIPEGFDSEDDEENDEEIDLPQSFASEEQIELDIIEDVPADDFDSEDELPLSIYVKRIVDWKKTIPLWPKIEGFIGRGGPNVPHNCNTPLDFFLCLFPNDLFEHIAFQTNLYATQSEKTYVPTNVDEIKIFIGLNLLMGIKKMPSYRDYWSSRAEMRDEYIASRMQRTRFDWLLSHIHLNDNSLQPTRNTKNFDKLYKVRPLLDKLSATFLECYKPHEHQAVDESMIRFKGRSFLKQFMPNKPIKRGYKVWVRANDTGYVSEFQIYTGKTEGEVEKDLGKRVVLRLTKSLEGKYHRVYFDNFFSSISLAEELLSRRIYCSSTARKGRKLLPEDLLDDKRLKRGEHDSRATKEGLSVVKWKDRKGILFISNYNNPSNITNINRKLKDGTTQVLTCPEVVTDYNAHMGAVDKADMLKHCYEVNRKSKKWWLRIFWHFIDVALCNAFILFTEQANCKTFTLKYFRQTIAISLIGVDSEKPVMGRPTSGEHQVNHFKRHIPYEVKYEKAAHLPIRSTSRRCAYCSSAKDPHRTKWMCKVCEVGLCLNDQKNCFLSFHSK